MTAVVHAPGAPCWFELATDDQPTIEAFYPVLFGWTLERTPMPDGSLYTIFQLDGRDVAGTYSLVPGPGGAGADGIGAPHWGVYFRTDDCDKAAARAVALGGRMIASPFELMEHVRMAVCADPEGVVFSLAQQRAHPGADVLGVDNAVCWAELATRDIDRAERYYQQLFGWRLRGHPVAPHGYRVFADGQRMLGGLLQMRPEWRDLAPHWSIYLQVPDVEACVQRALELGGRLESAPFEANSDVRIARLADPRGAAFYVIQFFGDPPA
ncbi:VOC family protein [Lysobacter enzymogenes]|uniref:Glyoxalase/bleomycin resistance protein/dioxygenase n=2 Tax=Bacteria TaxID=2 RepID=A0AAU9ASP9_LYSEN|nr:VOC family protein [Lysobacter enzymogenes]BAV99760.1 glyoxalase/bleomycin resistance protein/dioxygenase [Lysobacter enzymogenes]